MSKLTNNTTQLELLLTKVNELPAAGSGGTDLPSLTNEGTAGDLLLGKQLIDSDGNIVEGTIQTKTSSNLTASGATVTVPAGYYASQATKSVSSGSAKTPATTITKNPSISVNSSGLITASVSGTQNVTPTVTAGYVSSGTAGTITVSGSATKQLTTQAAKTVTPTTSSQTAVASGVYTTGAVTVAAIPSTYKNTSDATATANELFAGETAYTASGKITGTFTIEDELTEQNALISQISNLVATKANPSGEDVTAETNAYTTKIASLETAITALETELEGKASGGGASVETCTVTLKSGAPETNVVFYYSDGSSLKECMFPGFGSANIILTDVLKNSIVCTRGSASGSSGSYQTVYVDSLLRAYFITGDASFATV